MGALPQYIYGYNEGNVFVNLFIGSVASVKMNGVDVLFKQTTAYPWKGNIKVEVNPPAPESFAINMRIPGWAEQKENPFDLYRSKVNGGVTLKVNGQSILVEPINGYASIKRVWKKGDRIELVLPMAPRLIAVNEAVQTIKGKLAIASGPVVYGLESIDNPGLKDYTINAATSLKLIYKPVLLNGVNTINGQVADASGKQVNFTAIPFFSIGNREPGASYQVWIPEKSK